VRGRRRVRGRGRISGSVAEIAPLDLPLLQLFAKLLFLDHFGEKGGGLKTANTKILPF
jgi:hypothetical protein